MRSLCFLSASSIAARPARAFAEGRPVHLHPPEPRLLGLDVLPAGDEEVVLATQDAQITVLDQISEIPGVEPAVRVERPVYGVALDVAGEERHPPHQYLTVAGDPDLPVRQRAAGGAQLFVRSAGRCGGDLRGHLCETVAGVDREATARRLVH